MNIKHLTIIAAVSVLTACGGGGGGDSETSPTPTQAAAPVATTVTPAATTTPTTTTSTTSTTSTSTTTPTATTTPAPATTQTVSTPPAPTQVGKTSDLTADEDFAFTSSYQVGVSVNRNNAESAYLNICREFKSSPTGFSVNYDSCVLQTTLEDGKFSGEITLTNDVNELIVSIWLFNGDEPIHQVWNRATEGEQIVVN